MNDPIEQRTDSRDINSEVLEYLGVDCSHKNVVGVTLRIRGGRFPLLTVHSEPGVGQRPAIEQIKRFELRPIEPKTMPKA